MTIGLLGPMEARIGDTLLGVGGAKQRTVLALLALNVGHVVGVDQLLHAVWGEDAGPKATGTLQVYVSNLRRALGDQDGDQVVCWRRPGYLLALPSASVDVSLFTTHLAKATALRAANDLAAASMQLGAALALWRGPAIADLLSEPFAVGVAAGLDNQRLAALEERADLELALGRHSALIPELEELVRQHPLRERFWAQLMTALYRAGRQSDALGAFQTARRTLDEELGLDPGPELRTLEQAILTQSEVLRSPLPQREARGPTVKATGRFAPAGWLVLPRGERVPVGDVAVVLGRNDDVDLALIDARVSRRHAVVQPAPDGFELVDLGSTNGTLLNGQTIEPHVPRRLSHGDHIGIGTTSLTFLSASASL